MKNNSINKQEIERLLPHREPMLLVNKLTNIVLLKSATAIVNVKIGGGSGVINDIPDNHQVMGYPAVSLKDFVKQRKK